MRPALVYAIFFQLLFVSFAHASSASGCRVSTIAAGQSKLYPNGKVLWYSDSKNHMFFLLNCQRGGEVKFYTNSETAIPLLLLAKQNSLEVTIDFDEDESTGLTKNLDVLMH